MAFKCVKCGQKFNTKEQAKCGRCVPKPIQPPAKESEKKWTVKTSMIQG